MRGWLAWTVVAWHIELWSGLGTRFGTVSESAVLVFVIISGFVITNLIIVKRETYLDYLKRRFLRIYPVYFITLLLGIVASRLSYPTLLQYSLTDQAQALHFATQLREMEAHFAEHFLAHLFLIHGAIPNTVLPDSQFIFVAQAWSLSLEWQFYVLAPVVVFALARRWLQVIAVAIIVAAAVAYQHYLEGSFSSPSLLPGAGIYFLIGIGTRLAMEKLPTFSSYPFAFALGCLSIVLLSREMLPIAIWLCLVAYVRTSRASFCALDSRAAQWAGVRSYSVYLLHGPIVILATRVAVADLNMGVGETAAFVAVVTVSLTAIGSQILYRYVERPCIELGKRRTRVRSVPSKSAAVEPAQSS